MTNPIMMTIGRSCHARPVIIGSLIGRPVSEL
jgi:hypothetical protein